MILFLISFFSISAFSAESPALKLLSDLVSISSGSADVSGVDRVQDRLSDELKKIGMAVQLISNPDSKLKTGKLLVAEKRGQDARFLTLVGHADTVFETLNPYSSDGKVVRGSGVSDNKGGVVVGLTALQKFLSAPHRFSVRVIVSPNEETGSNGFHEVFRKYSEDSVFLFGLEPARESGNVVIGRKGVRWYHIKVTGKEAHAGVEHDSGVNACDEISILVTQLRKLTNYAKGTTVNIGRLEGGKNKFNIVCGSAEAKIDVRFETFQEAKSVFARIEKILSQSNVKSHKGGERTKIEFEHPVDSPPLTLSPKIKPFLDDYLATVQKLESKKISGEKTGGAADLNLMSREGLLMMDGLGPVGGGYHTVEEFAESTSFETRSEALYRLLKKVDVTL